MPRSGWLALGAAVAALVARPLGPGVLAGGPVAGLAVVALILACAAVAVHLRSPHLARTLAPLAIGVLAVTVRIALPLAGDGPAPAGLPSGDGPWRARVEALGSPRDGRQTATLALDDPPGLRVAATLPRYPTIRPGQIVSASGVLEPPPDDDYGGWLRRTGVGATLRSRSVAVERDGTDPPAALEAARRASGDALAVALPEPAAGLAAGILIGLRDRVDRDLASAFTAAGVSHVVAISGWNIAIVGGVVAAMLARLSRRARGLGILLAILGYTAFAGASPSVLRAAAMAAVVLLARESGRAGRAAAALGIASGLLLLVDPGLVGDAGFQLSVLATAGLLVWSAGIRARLERVAGGRLPAWLAESLALSTAAQLATLPVILSTFGRLSLVSPVANLVVAPVVPAAMAGGGLALVGGWATTVGLPAAVGTLLGLPGWIALGALIAIVRASAAVPFASVTLPPPLDVGAGAIAGLLALSLVPAVMARIRRSLPSRGPRARGRPSQRAAEAAATAGAGADGTRPARGDRRAGRGSGLSRASRLALACLVGAVLALGAAATARPDGRVRVAVLDVGQGDAILVEGERHARLLVDGGPDPDRLLVELDARIPAWDRRIDVVVLTHPHEDHVGGLPDLLGRYRVGRVLEPGMRGPGPAYSAFVARLAALGMTAGRLATGDELTIDRIRLRVLWPDPGEVPPDPPGSGSGINRASIVLLGEIGAGRFLLTGDVEEDVDPILVARGLPRVDLLKVAHHGSRTATTPAFLSATRPAVAVVSVGEGNTFGHPTPATLARLAGVGARVLRTDRQGTVTATFDGAVWAMSAERTAGAGVGVLGYHRSDDRPWTPGGRLDPALPRTAAVVHASLTGRRRDRRLVGDPCRGAWRDRRCPAGRGRGAAARRRQAPAGIGPGPPVRARGRLRGLAGRARPP